MPIQIVQSTSKVATGVNNTTLAFGSNVTAGNFIAVSQGSFLSGHSITTPTDTLGHTYVPMTAQQSISNTRSRSFYVEDITGGADTVTFDISQSSNGELAVSVAEFSGVMLVSPLDATSVNNNSGTAITTLDITPSENNCMLYGCYTSASNNVGITEEGGWTLIQEQVPAGSTPISTIFKVQTTATTEDADWTAASSIAWMAHVAAFKEQSLVSSTQKLLHMGVGG